MKLTVQGWQNLVLSAMGVVVLSGAVGGALLINRTDAVSSELIDHLQPARAAAFRLQGGLSDQETAVRGYAIAADSQFLAPYADGQRAESAAAQDVRRLLGGRDVLIADLEAVERAADVWRRSYAEPLVASVVVGHPAVVDSRTSERGKKEFDNLRALFDVQNRHLEQARNADIARLASIRQWRDRVLAIMIGAFVVMGLVLAMLVRSSVTRPLGALAAACRRITQGNFDERIVPQGPSDIRAIAVDVEEMRQRIVEELEASQFARAALDEQAGELRRSNAELEQFAYVASHDLQEPLRKVASFCQLLEKRYADKLDDRGLEYINFAVDGAKRMQVLINDLLTFSRVGRLNARHTEVDLEEVVAAAMNNLATAIAESKAQVQLPPDGLPRVDGDPTLLLMLWQNLIGNAVKFQREGAAPRIVIECGLGTGEDADNWVFTVSDNGIGIAEEFVDKVFVIFQRLHGRDAYSGTGIGLALCKKIVEHHGGTIGIDTSYTDGTRFVFTLPATPTTEPNVIAPEELEGGRP
ncbi:CHASE3 domain-containing protein [Mycolicibacterium sp. CBMA 226]|uniref:sensor histidine kinase n=1 Tax=Mycolicibacterium sp. CBMA 226 TaxID=2606611 RepID=UPI0012DDFCD5|nr:sensor histidine kinase [Mycolicibacterium sp. CBMA 226]MUL77081.1 HAMP domain-containing protein [Mycolicibacterium sp. CBMA 226]